jgi:hypothetical protein
MINTRSWRVTLDDIKALKVRLAGLKNAQGTSDALQVYLDACLWRDPVDVLNEFEALASLLNRLEVFREP